MSRAKKYLFPAMILSVLLFAVAQVPVVSCQNVSVQVESKAVSFIENVLGFDLKRNTVEIHNYYYENPEDLGGLLREYVTYKVKSESSEALIGFVFVDQALTRYSLNSVEGKPLYEKPLPSDALDATMMFLQRYNTYKGNTQLIQKAHNILSTVTELKAQNVTVDDLKLQITQIGDNTLQIDCKRVVNGLEFWNGFSMRIQDGVLDVFSDCSLYHIGSADAKISQQNAIDLAWIQAQTFKELNISLGDTTTIIPFSLKPEPLTAELQIHTRTEEPLTLYPLWYIQFRAQEIQYGINGIEVGIWAHTGEIAYAHFTGYQGNINPQTPSPPVSNSPATETNDNYLTQNNDSSQLTLLLTLAAIAVVVVTATAVVLKKRRP